MPDFDISSRFYTKLPEKEKKKFTDKEGLGRYLHAQQGQLCRLCNQKIEENHVAQIDHDIPEKRKGKIELNNLQLAHAECNAFKRDMTTEEVRPFCEFKRHLDELKKNSKSTKYGDVIERKPFKTKLKTSRIAIKNKYVEWEFPDGTSSKTLIGTDESHQRDTQYKFTYVEVPRAALFSDIEVQPRNINYTQLFKIYKDLVQNPLHEPPSCRLGPQGGSHRELLMFDGQHKTLAYWLHQKHFGVDSRITVKVYLDLDADQANELVVSIQSGVPKLVLTPFEISAKLNHATRVAFAPYLEAHEEDPSKMSEQGFIDFHEMSEERKKIKKYWFASIFDRVVKHDDFKLSEYSVPGRPPQWKEGSSEGALVAETTLKNKWVLQFINQSKLFDDVFDTTVIYRDLEVENIIWFSNKFVELMVNPSPGAGANGVLSDDQLLRRSRVLKQPSLLHISGLCKKLYRNSIHPTDALEHGLFQPMTDQQKGVLEKHLTAIADHPCWTAPESHGAKDEMKEFCNALSTNSGGSEAFVDVGLSLLHLLDTDPVHNELWN